MQPFWADETKASSKGRLLWAVSQLAQVTPRVVASSVSDWVGDTQQCAGAELCFIYYTGHAKRPPESRHSREEDPFEWCHAGNGDDLEFDERYSAAWVLSKVYRLLQ